MGGRLFEHLGVEQRELERIRVLEGEGGVTTFASASAADGHREAFCMVTNQMRPSPATRMRATAAWLRRAGT